MDTRKRLSKSAVEIAPLTREDLNISRAGRWSENFPVVRTTYFQTFLVIYTGL